MKTGTNYLKRTFLGVVAALLVSGAAHAQTLRVDGATPDPATVKPGENIIISLDLTNTAPATGTAIAAGTAVAADITFTHIDTGSTISYTGLTGTTDDEIEADGGAGTATMSQVTVPLSTTDAGEYRVSVTLTAGGPGNTASPGDVALTVEGKPDLQITSLTYPAGISYEGGDTIPMSLTYTNRVSSAGAPNVPYVPSFINDSYFRIRLVLSSNPTFGDADDFDLTWHDVGTRVNADGVDRSISWTQLLPGNFSGSYYVLAKIDVNEQVDESIEEDLAQNGNNVWFGGEAASDTGGDVAATRIALDPTNFPTVYWASDGGDGYSDLPVASEDGRYTAFASDSTNLVDGDTNARRDVFVFDQQASTVRRLSLSQQGKEGNGNSTSPFISSDASRVAFTSEAANLVLGDTNGFSDVFIVGTFDDEVIERVSVNSSGGQANGSSFRPSLSSDGRLVVFESNATNLASGAITPGVTNIFLRNTQTGTTTLVSKDSGGTAGNGDSTQARISADGRYVTFASNASNLVAGDTNGTRDIFRHDLQTGTTIRVSVATGGTQSNGFSRAPSITADGNMIAFHSAATNLVGGDSNGVNDIFVHTVSNNSTVRVSVSSAGAQASDPSAGNFQIGSINPSISATGRFVAFASLANNLTDGDRAGQYFANDSNRALDIFVHDRDAANTGTFDTAGNIATTMVSRNRFGMQTIRVLGQPSTAAADIFPAISADGRWVAFPSDAENRSGLAHEATNRISRDTNGFRDIFIHDRRINALPNPGNTPSVAITAPGDGSTFALNETVIVSADASTPVGTISSVEFFVGGASIGVVNQPPYAADWTPTVEGVYTLSALVIDNFSNQSVSNNVTVAVAAEVAGNEAVFHTGSYVDGFDTGEVTLLRDGSTMTFIASPAGGGEPILYSNVPVAGDGTFELRSGDTVLLSGQFIGAASTGQFGSARFVSSQVPDSDLYDGMTGFVYGSINGSGDSEAVFVIAPDGSMAVLLSEGDSFEVAEGTMDSDGAFSGTTTSGGRITGNLDDDTGFLTGRISGGAISGAVTGALSGDTPPSNGVMRNLSTRGNIGSGSSVMVAGFVVSGDVPKELLVRALGPTIGDAPYNVPGTITDPQITIFDSSDNEVTRNDNWEDDPNVPEASSLAGAFDLAAGSLDAATVVTLNPGSYTAVASGVGGATGVGIVEIYDVVTPSAFSDDKLLNVSTRGEVGTGDKVLIAGLIINGSTSKRVLIRAVGPTLGSDFRVANSLADPKLRLVRSDTNATVRENDDWETGNDATEVANVAAEVGAFPLPSGSKDAALLINLPPGIYTAIVDTGDGSSGISLVEVYEVP